MPGDADVFGGRVIFVHGLAGGGRARQAPPGTCEHCGCRLSHYRDESETLCWPCRAATCDDSSSGRVRRVLAFVLGAHPKPVPHRGYVCESCGGLKTLDARRCAQCRYRRPHSKRPAPHFLKGGPCPACGGRKNPKARLCRDCWRVDQCLLFAGNPARTCPRCGHPKVRKARYCRRCSDYVRHGTRYLGGRPVGLTCPDCGGPKRLKRAHRCRTCSLRYRGSRRRLDSLTA